ncbi:DUF2510 domain-containing protein [Leucobacter luti]|uniref:Transglutaminase superfamily protein n=1 Tax=Leucobacter luti TaxID=340320 RepID=A0A4Q7U6C3_9MICO|nr:DUF2510 domain-containing protein [Leucobacter luti]MBL3700538.1 DUF2510 domain-containing protein [Leucobacter luti]RZT68627.1 transglutaminase superfamily protein [Leucobacter luti]
MAQAPAPGWYADPSDPRGLRWWDGAQWTAHTAHTAHTADTAHTTDSAAPVRETAREAVGGGAEHGGGADGGSAERGGDAERSSADSAEPAPPRRRRLWARLGAAGIALVLVAAGALALPRLLGGSGSEAASTEPVVAGGLKYMPPIRVHPSEEYFDIPMQISLDEYLEQIGEERYGTTEWTQGVVELYADRNLTVAIGTGVTERTGPERETESWSVYPHAWNDTAWGSSRTDPSENVEQQVFDVDVYWSQFSEYWMKRSVDLHGEPLDVPMVTQLIPEHSTDVFEPVIPEFSRGAEDGSVKLSWRAPEGADDRTEYLIMRYMPSALSATEEDAWSTDLISVVTGALSYDTTDTRDGSQIQNIELLLYSGDSADEQEYGGALSSNAKLNSTNAHFAVVARQDGRFSPAMPVAPDVSLRSQPHSLAYNELREHGDPSRGDVGDLSELQTWLPITTIDGATRTMPIQFDPEQIEPKPDALWESDDGTISLQPAVKLHGKIVGTTMTTSSTSKVPDGTSMTEWVDQLTAFVLAFNERAISEQAATGGKTLTVEDADHMIDIAEYRKLAVADETPQVPYPVYGTHPMVKRIAANMYLGEPAIDVSLWKNEPGAPAPREAYQEAITQNPLLNYGTPLVAYDGDVVFIDYIFSQEERDAAIELSFGAAQEVAQSVSGLSESEQARVINQWIVDNVEYDYESVAELEGGSLIPGMNIGTIPYDSEFTAWSPIGVFRDGTAVCQGYAQAFALIAREAGLDTIIVVGEVVDGGAHAWNRVNVGGEWKSVDPTWNDSDENSERYLLINESDYTGNAERNADPTTNWIIDINQEQFNTP